MDTGPDIDFPGFLLLALQAVAATGTLFVFGVLIGAGIGRYVR